MERPWAFKSGAVAQRSPVQILPGRRVDPQKLFDRLRVKFGKGTWAAEMRHDQYRIYAREPLSAREIQLCYYDPDDSLQFEQVSHSSNGKAGRMG
jgi:hypothetical protein